MCLGGWNPVTSKVVFTFRLQWSKRPENWHQKWIRYSKTIPCHSRWKKQMTNQKYVILRWHNPLSAPKVLYWTERLRPHGILLLGKNMTIKDIFPSVKMMEVLLYLAPPLLWQIHEITFFCRHLVRINSRKRPVFHQRMVNHQNMMGTYPFTTFVDDVHFPKVGYKLVLWRVMKLNNDADRCSQGGLRSTAGFL